VLAKSNQNWMILDTLIVWQSLQQGSDVPV
jgi:hypothetical protein